MSKGPDVLERSAIPAGKVFIKAGEECERAYIVQVGEIAGFTIQDGQKVEIGRYGPGTMVGELCLMMDEPITMNYEALVTTTVITITRQDFQKRLSRVDKTIRTILDHAIKKISDYERVDIMKALRLADIDETALLLVRNLIKNLPDDKRAIYEPRILPHVNGLVKELKNLKKDEKKRA